MTIDEAIKQYKKLAKDIKELLESKEFETVDKGEKLDCLKRAEEYEQIVEWLKEYKRLASKTEQDIYERAYKDGYFFGYNKAIDDFKKELFKNSERARAVGWLGYSEIITCEKIYDIAEQLKVGYKE